MVYESIITKNPQVVVLDMGPGRRPVITVFGKTMPEVWEKSMWATHKYGIDIKTEYDKDHPGCPPSKDCRMQMVIVYPLAEPRIHRDFPAGIDSLEEYRLEVVEGIHDHRINPREKKWPYTYHDQLFNWLATADVCERDLKKLPFKPVDQIEYVVDKLSSSPYSRRAQATTWNPLAHPKIDDSPCLQRIWLRIFSGILNMDTDWRSRDAYKAAPMNLYAITDLQKIIAERVSEKTGKEVIVGPQVDTSNSYHLYGFYFEEFERFLKNLKERSFEDRTWKIDFAKPFFLDAIKKLLKEEDMPKEKVSVLERLLQEY